VAWSKRSGSAQCWGLAVSHIDADQKVFGPQNAAVPGSPNTYYVNLIGIQSIILSAAELEASTLLTTDTLEAFSINVNVQSQPGSPGRITFPLVQRMGFVTAVYTGLQPTLQSSIFFRTVVAAGSPKPDVYKYRVTLEDGKTWLVYAIPSSGVNPNLQLASNALLQGPAGFSGFIQVAKILWSITESKCTMRLLVHMRRQHRYRVQCLERLGRTALVGVKLESRLPTYLW
jgi:endo-1,3(4)-beta-glucanase